MRHTERAKEINLEIIPLGREMLGTMNLRVKIAIYMGYIHYHLALGTRVPFNIKSGQTYFTCDEKKFLRYLSP
jgi:hypothetical protein